MNTNREFLSFVIQHHSADLRIAHDVRREGIDTKLYKTQLHYITYTKFHCTTPLIQNSIVLHKTTLYYTKLYKPPLHYTKLHYCV